MGEKMDSVLDTNLQPRSFRPEAGVWKKVALRAMEEINTPVSLAIYLQLLYGEFEAVARRQVNPHQYADGDSFQRDFMAAELLRKFAGLPGTNPKDRKSAALLKAAEAEDRCRETNERFRSYAFGTGIPPSVERLLSKARRKIFRTLGDYNLSEHLDGCRWGPGSDFLNRKPYVSAYHKFKGGFASTLRARSFLPALLSRNHLLSVWLSGDQSTSGIFTPLCLIVEGNEASTVPKTALTDRFICIEPGANVYLQLGLGRVIRRRLRNRGIDLSSQELNRHCALLGSKDSYWCTIDLSSASDTIARCLVQYLFDYNDATRKWYEVMDRLRSPFTNYGTRKRPHWLLNQKFSSMGNGFTFELETLIFWALVNAVAEEFDGEVAAVYGDDIIVSRNIYHQVVELLEFCGFQVNTRKSYNSSYFRESCGMNAWNGQSLTTYRLETLDTLADVYSFHNGLKQCGLNRAAQVLLRTIPRQLRYFGPESAGDVVLHSDLRSSWVPASREVRGLRDGWFWWSVDIKCLAFTPMKKRVRAYEPAILHSFATMVPEYGPRRLTPLGRYGSEGLVTLSDGEWTVGTVRLERTSWETLDVDPVALF